MGPAAPLIHQRGALRPLEGDLSIISEQSQSYHSEDPSAVKGLAHWTEKELLENLPQMLCSIPKPHAG